MTDAADAVVATGFGATRAEALTEVMGAWNERAALTHMRPLDGAGVFEALRNVRAI
ncbi:MAG TPA: hypothetical protein VM580_35390 [Labilithrix sp.]|nr:hypothetical protein [Labilithrix sp.]